MEHNFDNICDLKSWKRLYASLEYEVDYRKAFISMSVLKVTRNYKVFRIQSSIQDTEKARERKI